MNRSTLFLSALALGSLHCGARSGLRSPDARVDVVDAQRDVLDVVDVVDVVDTVETFDCNRDPVALCDDQNRCTIDRCLANGSCDHSQTILCDDQDPCTRNTCVPTLGCAFPQTECGGCADGQREAFRDLNRYPDIAACSGGFLLPGLARETSPACGRAAGDDGPNPNGNGCAASDLCAPGFHVCRSAGEVQSRTIDGCVGASDGPSMSFFATRQTGPGCLQCATGTRPDCTAADCRADCAPTTQTTNDIFGCGSLGSSPAASCGPLNRSGNNLCSALRAPWNCNSTDPNATVRESEFVVKSGPEAGGVLCCRD